MLKQLYVTVVLDTEVEHSIQDQILVDIKEPLLSSRHIVSQQHDEACSYSGGVQDSDGGQDYTFVCDREPHRIVLP